MKKILLLLVLTSLFACKKTVTEDATALQETAPETQNVHQDPTHNFTVERLIIVNDKDEMLMTKQVIWATPSLVFDTKQYVKERLDSVAAEYGIAVKDYKLRGHFCYKYDYHPYATNRTYYTATYVSGNLKVPSDYEEVKWMSIDEAIENTGVTAMQQIKKQIFSHPDTVWGGSFMVSRNDGEHPTKMVEGFYPLF